MSKEKRKVDDLHDSVKDRKKLKEEETTIDLPDVKDIPGQEHVHPPKMEEYADVTISSADEEGENVWRNNPVNEENSDVSDIEKKLLDESALDMPTADERRLKRAELDNTDNEGDLLNEKSSGHAISGSDLDVPGADDDNEDEDIGEEDEENNPYRLGSDDNSINEERSGA
jgi:hypothetical protein